MYKSIFKKKYKMQNVQIFMFRKDLRLNDNTALNKANENKIPIIPLFMFDNNQINSKINKFYSQASVNFMLQSIIDLYYNIKKYNSDLMLLQGNIDNIYDFILHLHKNNLVVKYFYVNNDYTPYSKKRDAILKNICKKLNIEFIGCDDLLLLHNIDYTDPKSIYKKFTPFYNKYKNTKINSVNNNNKFNFINFSKYTKDINKFNIIKDVKDIQMFFKSGLIHQKGGRKNALKIIQKNLNNTSLKNYDQLHNTLTFETTRLSPHIKFGTISIREAYFTFKKINSDLVRQLFWHDFYYLNIYSDENALKNPFRKLNENYTSWTNNNTDFKNWCNGRTGVPIVDACMMQLNKTHYMHNRGRLIVADYLIKHLNINWQLGEKYFANNLVDYDPVLNNYNWQFVAGSGPSAAAPFRKYNPYRQSKLNDPDCKYIKKWIPALKNVPNDHIHNWDIYCKEYIKKINYP